MNCPQCQTANGPGSAFCGNCGAQITVAPATAPADYPPPQGTTVPPGYGASSAPTEYGAPQGYNAAGGYNSGGPTQPGYPQGQYQPPGARRPAGPAPVEPAARQL